MIFKKVYEDVVLRFWKLILFFIISIVILLSFQIKNLAIDASSETLILENDKQFSHLIADSMDNRPEFLKDLFENEDRYPYLIKEWDSKNDGFTYHVKIFKIDYNLFNLEIEK